jgi:hypothetical protein
MAPIRTEAALWGYISIAECTHQLGLLDLSAVEAAANAVALIVWKKRALEQRTREQQTRFIGDLLFADQDSESLTSRALLLGYEPAERYTAVVLEWRHGGDDVRAAVTALPRCASGGLVRSGAARHTSTACVSTPDRKSFPREL